MEFVVCLYVLPVPMEVNSAKAGKKRRTRAKAPKVECPICLETFPRKSRNKIFECQRARSDVPCVDVCHICLKTLHRQQCAQCPLCRSARIGRSNVDRGAAYASPMEMVVWEAENAITEGPTIENLVLRFQL